MKVKVVNKSKHKLPQYSTKGSAGMDLRQTLNPNHSKTTRKNNYKNRNLYTTSYWLR